MYLARVIGRLVASQRYTGLEGVALQLIQPLDESGAAMGDPLVATATVSTGPGDLVHFVDGREAALACPETFVPVDAAILGFVEQADVLGRDLAQQGGAWELGDSSSATIAAQSRAQSARGNTSGAR